MVLNMRDSDPQGQEREVLWLHELLHHTEQLHYFTRATEIFDLNRYRVIRKEHLVERVLREREVRPFIFIGNKN